jgi:hypothetical protein
MAVSNPVRTYYAERIFAEMGRDRAPTNFVPMDQPYTGRATVEGCLGGGKNITEFQVRGEGDRIVDVCVSCGLCNPAMYVAADILVSWARGRDGAEILKLDASRFESLAPFFEALGGGSMPDDAREKFQYALLGVQNAVRDHRGEPTLSPPAFDEPSSRDWADPDDNPDSQAPAIPDTGRQGLGLPTQE